MATFFSDFFDVDRRTLDEHGAFNISLVNDLPLFIDPFLLFNSPKPEYQHLHRSILRYIIFLRDEEAAGNVNKDLEKAWFYFPDIKQNWLGFSVVGNGGTGLGAQFASALRRNIRIVFSDFGRERISKGSHIEKVCLINEGVGRDNISDFTLNLIIDYICRYTEVFAIEHVSPDRRKEVWIQKAIFDYNTKSWQRKKYSLPFMDNDFVLLTPKDILTRDENWINRGDMIHDFDSIPPSIPDVELRGQVFNYFANVLAKPKGRAPSRRERADAAARTILKFPEIIDYYIRLKEQKGDQAKDISKQKVLETETIFERNVKALQADLLSETAFYNLNRNTYEEAHQRVAYLKDVIENKGGHRIFYHQGKPIQRESDLQILFRFVWFGSPSDVGSEANDGRGPVDYKISRGARDKTLVEMKLAKNTALERNLEKQLPIYQAASDAANGIKVIIFFTLDEQFKIERILQRLKLGENRDVVLIDARADNKPSGSKA
ncbi:hypothetical protein [Salinarimonas sp.]|uniref:hypothetical protein n=1 Tax=Salinarimonas sp. TaxID=2766526 RepID=UPI00391BDCFA